VRQHHPPHHLPYVPPAFRTARIAYKTVFHYRYPRLRRPSSFESPRIIFFFQQAFLQQLRIALARAAFDFVSPQV
jgi:hypothetical protein